MHIVNALLRRVLAHTQLTSIPRGQDRGVRDLRLAHPHPRFGRPTPSLLVRTVPYDILAVDRELLSTP